MFVNTKYRSKEVEIMDDLDLSSDILINALDQIANINKWLGGNSLTIDGIKKILKNQPKGEPISIIDLGCGNGDMLREVAEYGKKHELNLQLFGLDANEATIDYAKELSIQHLEISYHKEDVFSEEFKHRKYDIALCTLFLHHFEDKVALDFIQKILANSKMGIVINDLHRHPMAYYLFKLLTLVIKNPMVKNDGLTSVLRGFKRIELERFSKKINYKSTLSWRWAFRYQWIVYKT